VKHSDRDRRADAFERSRLKSALRARSSLKGSS
jgi:hypothetical protein